jgi:hypothetical protein
VTHGFTVLLGSRNLERGEAAAKEIGPGGPGRSFIEEASLSPEQKELFAHEHWQRLIGSIRQT